MDIKKDLQNIYTDIAQEFSVSRKFAWEELQVFIPYLEHGFKVLDLGCGNGRLLNALDESGKKFTYLGVDFVPRLIEHARQLHPEQKFEVGDITKLDFPKESFDIVFSIATFHHLSTLKERRDLLKKINRWLKPGGLLIMTNWNLWQPKYLKDYFKYFWKKRSLGDFFVSWQMYLDKNHPHGGKKHWRYYHSFSQSELENLFKNAGFKLEPKGVYKTQWNVNCLVSKK